MKQFEDSGPGCGCDADSTWYPDSSNWWRNKTLWDEKMRFGKEKISKLKL